MTEEGAGRHALAGDLVRVTFDDQELRPRELCARRFVVAFFRDAGMERVAQFRMKAATEGLIFVFLDPGIEVSAVETNKY